MDYSLFKFPKGKSLKRRKDVSSTNRQKIKQIFHYQCALCKKKGTQIHHIVPRSEDKTLIDDTDNLVLLCCDCHSKVHTNMKYWKPRLKNLRERIGRNESN